MGSQACRKGAGPRQEGSLIPEGCAGGFGLRGGAGRRCGSCQVWASSLREHRHSAAGGLGRWLRPWQKWPQPRPRPLSPGPREGGLPGCCSVPEAQTWQGAQVLVAASACSLPAPCPLALPARPAVHCPPWPAPHPTPRLQAPVLSAVHWEAVGALDGGLRAGDPGQRSDLGARGGPLEAGPLGACGSSAGLTRARV